MTPATRAASTAAVRSRLGVERRRRELVHQSPVPQRDVSGGEASRRASARKRARHRSALARQHGARRAARVEARSRSHRSGTPHCIAPARKSRGRPRGALPLRQHGLENFASKRGATVRRDEPDRSRVYARAMAASRLSANEPRSARPRDVRARRRGGALPTGQAARPSAEREQQREARTRRRSAAARRPTTERRAAVVGMHAGGGRRAFIEARWRDGVHARLRPTTAVASSARCESASCCACPTTRCRRSLATLCCRTRVQTPMLRSLGDAAGWYAAADVPLGRGEAGLERRRAAAAAEAACVGAAALGSRNLQRRQACASPRSGCATARTAR